MVSLIVMVVMMTPGSGDGSDCRGKCEMEITLTLTSRLLFRNVVISSSYSIMMGASGGEGSKLW